ncbi:MAG TPA: Glu/Leu/Phe/Val dehydrogenase family protein, partial [Chitinophagales bacterium]
AGGTGDPSPVTAHGVYLGIKAATKFATGNESLNGKKIVVQGAGHVGQYLIDSLVKEGAIVSVADINEQNLKTLSAKHKVNIISPDEVFKQEADIFAPCALGAILNTETIRQLKVQVVAGAANNQLTNEVMHGHQLKDKGIVYAPDFLINGGGVINCYREVHDLSEKETFDLVEKIYDKTLEVLERAKRENGTPQETAITIAKERIEKEKLKKQK